MRTNIHSIALVMTLALAGTIQAASFKIIANNSTRLDSVSKKDLSNLFMKRTTKWPDGIVVVAVDQADTSAVRDDFSRSVHGKPTVAIRSYWNQQIFGGREVPPVQKKTDAEVVAFVRATVGAIGYVSEATPTDGVRVVSLQQ